MDLAGHAHRASLSRPWKLGSALVRAGVIATSRSLRGRNHQPGRSGTSIFSFQETYREAARCLPVAVKNGSRFERQLRLGLGCPRPTFRWEARPGSRGGLARCQHWVWPSESFTESSKDALLGRARGMCSTRKCSQLPRPFTLERLAEIGFIHVNSRRSPVFNPVPRSRPPAER